MEIGEVHSPPENIGTRLPPANPLYTKSVLSQEPKPVFRFQFTKNQILYRGGHEDELSRSTDAYRDARRNARTKGSSGLLNDNSRIIYQKFDNSRHSVLCDVKYESGLFLPKKFLLGNKKLLNGLPSLLKQLDKPSKESSKVLPTRQGQDPKENEIVFDSNFQSGNLFSVSQVCICLCERSKIEYDLTLQKDINSKGNTQWFYFSVTNLPSGVDIVFNILNLLKSDSLFNYGMQPTVFSRVRNKLFGEGWKREGKSISYYKSNTKREDSKKNYYVLTFTLRSKMQEDTLLVSHCFPYTYTMLQDYISGLLRHPSRQTFVTRALVCKSIAQHNIDVITITSPSLVAKQIDQRRVILILARQHPGQSQGSYVCQGLVTNLLSGSASAEFLTSNYIVKVIPMPNPDGVVFGNYRTNLLGADLNRKWEKGNDGLCPEVTGVKSYIQSLHKEYRIRIVIDLHGHSKKLGSFFYGNPNQQFPEEPRLFPYICSKISKHVVYNDCTFSVSESKRTSARVYLSEALQMQSIYTYQASFYGHRREGQVVPFTIQAYQTLGVTLCEGLHSMLQGQTDTRIHNQFEIELKSNLQLLKVGDDGGSGSDSKAEQFELDKEQIGIIDDIVRDSVYKQQCQQERTCEPNSNAERPANDEAQGYAEESCQEYPNSSREVFQKCKKKTKQVLPMNQINSMSPSKYELALSPVSTPFNKVRIKQKLSRSLREYNKVNVHTQTFESQAKFQERDNDNFFILNRSSHNSTSMSSTVVKKGLNLKLEIDKKVPSLKLMNTKTSHASTQTYVSNLLMRYSPRGAMGGSSTQLVQTMKITSMLKAATKPFQRLSISERASDLMRRRNLNPISQQISLDNRADQVSKSLQVKRKFVFTGKSIKKR